MSADIEQSHEIALIQLGDEAAGPSRGQVGLNHMAWMMHSLDDLKDVYQRIKDNGIPIERVSDHGVSIGIYLRDPRRQRRRGFLRIAPVRMAAPGEAVHRRRLHRQGPFPRPLGRSDGPSPPSPPAKPARGERATQWREGAMTPGAGRPGH